MRTYTYSDTERKTPAPPPPPQHNNQNNTFNSKSTHYINNWRSVTQPLSQIIRKTLSTRERERERETDRERERERGGGGRVGHSPNTTRTTHSAANPRTT